jgi:hypothetical protein
MGTPEECLRTVRPLVSHDSNAYKFLSNGSQGAGSILLSKHDKRIMITLLYESFNILVFEAVKIGDRVTTTD